MRVILDDLRSLSNAGSIFRTSDAFMVDHLYLCGITGKPPHREIQRTALGATESVSWSYEEDVLTLLKDLKNKGYTIAAIEQGTKTITPHELASFHFEKIVLVLGNEVEGVKQAVLDMADVAIEIPQSGTKHSLNVTVAAGIVMWECYAQFKNAR